MLNTLLENDSLLAQSEVIANSGENGSVDRFNEFANKDTE